MTILQSISMICLSVLSCALTIKLVRLEGKLDEIHLKLLHDIGNNQTNIGKLSNTQFRVNELEQVVIALARLHFSRAGDEPASGVYVQDMEKVRKFFADQNLKLFP